MNSVQLFASLLLVAAVAGQDYTYDYYEPEAVVAKLAGESSDTVCTDMTVQIKMSDSSSFETGTAVADAVIARAAMDATGIGRTFAITNSDMVQSQATGKVTLTMEAKTEDSSDCGHFFKRVATVAEAQLRVQEAVWEGALAS